MNPTNFHAPMEPKLSHQIPIGENWIAQVKWDGVRILTHVLDSEVTLWNRHGRKRTHQYPELLNAHEYVGQHSVILDGEMIALGDDGKPSFHEVMRRDGIRKLGRVATVMRQVPVFYMVFDILYLDGTWCVNFNQAKRNDLLKQTIVETSYLQCVKSDRPEVIHAVTAQFGLEGIVAKRLDSLYTFAKKSGNWIKVKHYQDAIVVIGGYTVNDADIANALLVGLYDEHDQLIYIGHVGSGRFTQMEWKDLTSRLRELRVPNAQFTHYPRSTRDALWVAPLITVKIHYMQWPKNMYLRQPSIQAITDVKPKECRMPARD